MEGSSLIQLLTYAAMIASSLFVPLMAESFGASPLVVGMVVGAYNSFYFLSSYVFGILADRFGGKYILRLGLLLSAAFFALQIFAHDLFSLFIIRALAGMSAGIFPAALVVYAYSEHKGKMGRFAGSGSLGWAMGALLAGLIVSNQAIFALSAVFFVAAFFLSLQVNNFPPKVKAGGLLPLGILRRNARIYIPYFLRSVGVQTVWAIFPLYLVAVGADKFWVGIAYFVNTFAQFLIMPRIERFGNMHLINLGLLSTVITFAGYALFPSLPAVLLLQLLLAFSFSTLQVGALHELLGNNVEQSTAMGLLNSLVNIAAVIGPFMGGVVIHYYGFSGMMWFGAILSFVGLVSFTTVIE